ncbi:hypothetical protein [Naumannella huperziae]
MIPPDWIAHHRADDDELLGYLRPEDDGFVPVTVFGHPLGERGDRDGAAEALDSRGLSYLAEPWLLRAADGSERRVAIIEASPERVVVSGADYAFALAVGANVGEPIELAVPTDRLRPA